jgi:hypothetical protein
MSCGNLPSRSLPSQATQVSDALEVHRNQKAIQASVLPKLVSRPWIEGDTQTGLDQFPRPAWGMFAMMATCGAIAVLDFGRCVKVFFPLF